MWGPNTTKACINITIINDNIAENDEVFFVNMVRVVTSPDLTSPSLELTTVMIMDDDCKSSILYHLHFCVLDIQP